MSDAPATTPVETTESASADESLLTGATEPEATGKPEAEGAAAGNDGGAADTGNSEGDATAGEGDTDQSLDAYADLKAPEGMELDGALIEKATPLFKELGLNQEQAQKLTDFYASEIQASTQRQVESFDQLKQDWLTEVKSDKEVGGDKLDQSVQLGKVALDKFGTPELTKLLNDFGLGNNPEMIRFMARVGKLTQEDDPGNGGSSASEKKDRVSILYPNS
jgi:hypothetical protein